MRILITGGAGFIGSHVVEAALASGHQPAVLDDLSTGKAENLPAGVPLFQVDLRDAAATLQAVEDFRPDAISHQAAQASVTISMRDPAFDASVNVLGGLHLLEAAVHVGVHHMVFASTGGAIYGEVPDGCCAAEDHATDPISPYAIHKLTFERLLDVYRHTHGLRATVLRYANVYGPRQDPHGEAGVVAIFFNRARSGEPLQINARRTAGDAGCVRDYVYVEDIARANLLALEGRLDTSVLNCATGVGTDTRELATAILSVSNLHCEMTAGGVREGDLQRSVLDPSEFRRLVGEPRGLREGLGATAAWYAAR